jgi:hypothetical protein
MNNFHGYCEALGIIGTNKGLVREEETHLGFTGNYI